LKWLTSAEPATREDHACLLELAPRQLAARVRETTRYGVPEVRRRSWFFARALHLGHFAQAGGRFFNMPFRRARVSKSARMAYPGATGESM